MFSRHMSRVARLSSLCQTTQLGRPTAGQRRGAARCVGDRAHPRVQDSAVLAVGRVGAAGIDVHRAELNAAVQQRRGDDLRWREQGEPRGDTCPRQCEVWGGVPGLRCGSDAVLLRAGGLRSRRDRVQRRRVGVLR